MKIAVVLGKSILQFNELLPPLHLVFVAPLSVTEIQAELKTTQAEEFVALDGIGVNLGDWVAVAEGPEAAKPFLPQTVPVDAYIVGLVHAVNWN